MNAAKNQKPEKTSTHILLAKSINAITQQLEDKKAQYKYPKLQENLTDQLDVFDKNLAKVEELSKKLTSLKDSLENQLSVDAMDEIEAEIRQTEKELLVSKNIAKQQYFDRLEPLHDQCEETKGNESTEDIPAVEKAKEEIVKALFKDIEPIYHTIIAVVGSLESAHNMIKDSFLDYHPLKLSKNGYPIPGNIKDLDLRPISGIKKPERAQFEEIPEPQGGWISEVAFDPLIVDTDDYKHLYIYADEPGYRLKIGTWSKNGHYQKWVGDVKFESKAKEYAKENGIPELIPYPSIFDGIDI